MTDSDYIFILLQYTLLHKEQVALPEPPDADLAAIFDEMQVQAVATLVYPWLRTEPAGDRQLLKKWSDMYLQQKTRWIVVMHAQDQLIKLLEEHDIPCVIIKGAAAMMSYPEPSLRAVGDIDFLVSRKDYDRAAKLLEDNGFKLSHEKDPSAHHYGYHKDGVSFELHKRLAIIRDTDEKMLSLFENGISNRVWHDMEGFRIPTLPDDLNGLVLLFHINQHLRSGLGLRHIVDWMMYLDKHDNLDKLMPLFSSIGLEKFAITVTLMCRKYLGLSCSSVEELNSEQEDYPCDELKDYILSKGNFGRKNVMDNRIESFSLSARGPAAFFRRLQKGGMARWKAARKHKILRPFAWIYQTGRIIGELIRNKVSPNKFKDSHDKGIEQRELILNLGLDVDRFISEH